MSKLIFPSRQPVRRTEFVPILRSGTPVNKPTDKKLNKNFDFTRESQLDSISGSGIFPNIVGITGEQSEELSREEVSLFGDFFTQNILLQNVYPLTLRELLDAADALQRDSKLTDRNTFLVAEGAQHRRNDPSIELNARLVLTWRRRNFGPVDMMLSTVPALDDGAALLQLISWSDTEGTFHYFERLDGIWTWAGNGFHSQDPRSRGKGPFDSHINGGLVMKELRFPWAHWHSQSSSIPEALLAETDWGNHSSLSGPLDGAEHLESIVRRSNRAWTKTRINAANPTISFPHALFRQVVIPTSANLVSSPREFQSGMTGPIRLPTTFFIDEEAIVFLWRAAGLDIAKLPDRLVEIDAAEYCKALEHLDIGVQMEAGGPRVLGDTHFCFLVPERAHEDFLMLSEIVHAKLTSARFLLCCLLVDFGNPLRSKARAQLLQHLPEAPLAFNEGVLEQTIMPNIRTAASISNSPESEFLEYADATDFAQMVAERINNFFEVIRKLASTSAGVLEIVRLAESRRIEFRRRKLHEFSSTMASAKVLVPTLSMTRWGEIERVENKDKG